MMRLSARKEIVLMLECREESDLSQAIAYLRRDVLRNVAQLESLERNVPPVPRRVVTARAADGEILGVLIIEEFPHGKAGKMSADAPEAVAALARTAAAESISYTLDVHMRNRVLREMPSTVSCVALSRAPSAAEEAVTMALRPEGVSPADCACEVRKLSLADKPLTDDFPPPQEGEPGHPPLSLFVQWAEKRPAESIVFGAVEDGRVAAFVQFKRCIDNLWDVGMIRTAPEHRGRGLAKALLAHAAAHLLEECIVTIYEVRSGNVASVATAKAVGYTEIGRHVTCSACAASEDR